MSGVVQMQQAMVSSIKAQQYEDALSIADQSTCAHRHLLSATRHMSSTGSLLTVLKSKPNDTIVQELRKTLAEKLSLGDTVSKGTLDLFISVISAACMTAQSLCCAWSQVKTLLMIAVTRTAALALSLCQTRSKRQTLRWVLNRFRYMFCTADALEQQPKSGSSTWLLPCFSCRMMHQSQVVTHRIQLQHILASLYVMCCVSLLTTRLCQFSSACSCALLSRNSLMISKLTRQHSKCTY